MLGKLIKHEWKSTYKMGCLILGAMVLITFLGWLAFQTPMWKSLGGRGSSFGWLDILSIITLMTYVMLLVCANFGLLIYVGVHFYRTMYTDEGYLTHTLPVTKGQILFSKVLVSGLWMLFMVLAEYLSFCVLGMTVASTIFPERSLLQLWSEFSYGMWEFFTDMGTVLEFEAFRMLVSFGIASLVGPFTTVIILFGAVSIGQLASRYRFFMGVLCYIGIMVANSMISGIFRSFAVNAMDSSYLVNLLMAVGMYAVSWYVINRKLNLT